MFWAKEEEENSLVVLLKTDNFTLRDVLLDDHVVQESRYGRLALITFLTREENMIEMLNLCLNPTIDDETPLKKQYRLSFIASEILTSRGSSSDIYHYTLITCEETKTILTNFINDKTPLNHLIAGFFAKIIECLLSKTFDATYSILEKSNFFEKCLQNINLGAIECLLENLVRIPALLESVIVIKRWMIQDKLFDKLIDNMNEDSSDDVNECLSDVYCEIVRELRDKLYIFENKEDPLHDDIMNEDRIAKIADKLLVENHADSAEISKKTSVIKSAAQILETLIRSNFVLDSPSHLIDKEEKEDLEDRHAKYSSGRVPDYSTEHDEQLYQPDAERIVEGIVANRLPNLMQTIVTDLENNGVVWQYLLKLIIEVANTNYMPTHEKILLAFEKLPFIKLIEVGKTLPKASILHSLVVKLLHYLLYTKFENARNEMSPVTEYLLKKSGLIDSIHETAFNFQPTDDLVSVCGLRTFNMNLAHSIFKARQFSSSAKQIDQILENNQNWRELEEAIKEYNEEHRPLNLGRSKEDDTFNSDSHMRQSDGIRDYYAAFEDNSGNDDSDEWADASTKLAQMEMKMKSMDIGEEEGSKKRDSDPFNFNMGKFSELNSSGEDHFDDTPDEDEFKKLCSERANSVNETAEGRSSTTTSTATFEWPGVSEPAEGATAAGADESAAEVAEESQDWVWPTKPPIGETQLVTEAGPRPPGTWAGETETAAAAAPAGPADEWADFSSFSRQSAPASAAAVEMKWPGEGETQKQGESVDWPLTSSHDSKPTDPATVGLASGISHNSVLDNGSSDA